MLINKFVDKIKGKSNSKQSSKESIKHKVPLAYVYIYFKLREVLKNRCSGCFLQTSDVINALQMTLKIPKRMKYLVLAEMEEHGLLKRVNHQKYYISDKSSATKELKRISECMEGYPFW
jgi:hypothetical protein